MIGGRFRVRETCETYVIRVVPPQIATSHILDLFVESDYHFIDLQPTILTSTNCILMSSRPSGSTAKPAKPAKPTKTAKTTVMQATKGKGKARSTAVEVDGEDGMSGNEGGVKVDHRDPQAQAAAFTVNVMNVLDPPLPLEFGRWNDRPMVPSVAQGLFDTMKSQQVHAYKFMNLIPLVASKSEIDPSCVSLDYTRGENGPVLKLTAEGLRRKVIVAAGGRHRVEAVRLMVEEGRQKVAKLKERIAKEEKHDWVTTEEATKRTDKLEVLRKKAAQIGVQTQRLSHWGVIVYERGEWSTML